MTGAVDEHGTPRSKPTLAVALVVLALAFVGFCALGVWQVQRLQWKHALIERVDTRVHAEPVPAPGRARWATISVERDEYRRVVVHGRFLQDRDTRVQALTELGAGFWVLSPLRTDDGTVLVNRGFVPTGAQAAPPPDGPVRVQGLLRLGEAGGGVLRSNDPGNDRWYSRDVAAIATARGLTDVAPYFIDAGADPATQGWPRGGMTVVKFRDHHLQYALTWFALAALTAFMGWYLLSSERRLRHHARYADTDSARDQRH